MHSRWDEAEAAACATPLALRACTSRFLGRDPGLVLQGGGNTSVKGTDTDLFGEPVPVLYVKGSGWDLATIQEAGFAPVRLDVLRRMARLDRLRDLDMVRAQRAAMTDPGAPTPSIEAILHAIIPFDWVDHTHADAVVTITNTPDGERRIRELYGPRVLVIPYVMPGFDLARVVLERMQSVDWGRLEGMILLNHGVFTWADTARQSYDRMIQLVDEAEQYLARTGGPLVPPDPGPPPPALDPLALARLRQAASHLRGRPMVTHLDRSPAARHFSRHPDVASLVSRGTLTPDHVIRTRPHGAVIRDDPAAAVGEFAAAYHAYVERHRTAELRPLDPAPRWAVWPGQGTVAFGDTAADAALVSSIVEHTRDAILRAESLGGWQPLGEAELFAVEYWELEQAKLRGRGSPPEFQGKVALVTGAAGGIGLACAQALRAAGAAVVGVDLNPAVAAKLTGPAAHAIVCDLTDPAAARLVVQETVERFGGLDLLVSNAGRFPPSADLASLEDDAWRASLDLNLSSHQALLRAAIPFLKLGLDPAVVIVGSKNVPAPGPGAAAYSVAKAGLTQLARVAALELAGDGIRVNVVHPHAVFDTGAWSPEVLEQRARSYGITVEEYKARNLLGAEVASADVAALVLAMLGRPFARTTGAQVPIDGGNDRVI